MILFIVGFCVGMAIGVLCTCLAASSAIADRCAECKKQTPLGL